MVRLDDIGSRRGKAVAVAYAAVAGLLFSMAVTSGCSGSEPWKNPGPTSTFRTFLMHWFKGESEKAYAMLAPEDREELEAPRDFLGGRLADDEMPEKHRMLVAGRVDNPYDLKRIEPDASLEDRPEDGEKVELDLTYHDGREGRAPLVWRDEQWYVDLPVDETRPFGVDNRENSSSAETSNASREGADAGDTETKSKRRD